MYLHAYGSDAKKSQNHAFRVFDRWDFVHIGFKGVACYSQNHLEIGQELDGVMEG
jgi:hypothetical protein